MAELEGPEQRRRRRGFRVTTKYQVSGVRFLYRRLRHALVRHDGRMIDDPQRAQSTPLYTGLLTAVIFGVGTFVYSIFQPAGHVEGADIVVNRDTGALYVRVGPRLDPVTNLTSARLIVGRPLNPTKVSSAEIAKYPHGSLVGIVGAPSDVRNSTDPSSIWSVCDTTMTGAAVPLDPVSGLPSTAMSPVTTTVIGGPLTVSAETSKLSGNQARLVAYDNRAWLIYARPDGVVVRSTLDLKSAVVADALGLKANDLLLPISQGLFNAIPSEPPLFAPIINGVGEPPAFPAKRPLTVGTILKVTDLSGGTKYYATLPDGVQEVALTAATMIRAANPQVSTEPVQIGPDELAGMPKSNQLDIGFYPSGPVQLVPADHEPVTCWSWAHSGDEPTSTTQVIVGRTLPLTDQQSKVSVSLVSAASSKGMTADRAYMPPTSGRFVQITGAATDAKSREGYFWVADNGVRFGLDNTDQNSGATVLASLGLSHSVPAPWNVISLFAPGPTLSQADARVRHDGVPGDKVVEGVSEKEIEGKVVK